MRTKHFDCVRSPFDHGISGHSKWIPFRPPSTVTSESSVLPGSRMTKQGDSGLDFDWHTPVSWIFEGLLDSFGCH